MMDSEEKTRSIGGRPTALSGLVIAPSFGYMHSKATKGSSHRTGCARSHRQTARTGRNSEQTAKRKRRNSNCDHEDDDCLLLLWNKQLTCANYITASLPMLPACQPNDLTNQLDCKAESSLNDHSGLQSFPDGQTNCQPASQLTMSTNCRIPTELPSISTQDQAIAINKPHPSRPLDGVASSDQQNRFQSSSKSVIMKSPRRGDKIQLRPFASSFPTLKLIKSIFVLLIGLRLFTSSPRFSIDDHVTRTFFDPKTQLLSCNSNSHQQSNVVSTLSSKSLSNQYNYHQTNDKLRPIRPACLQTTNDHYYAKSIARAIISMWPIHIVKLANALQMPEANESNKQLKQTNSNRIEHESNYLKMNQTISTNELQLNAESSTAPGNSSDLISTTTVATMLNDVTNVTSLGAFLKQQDSITTMSTNSHANSNALPINVICNGRCECIKLTFQQMDKASDETALIKSNDDPNILKRRENLQSVLRSFNDINSMFADEDHTHADGNNDHPIKENDTQQKSPLRSINSRFQDNPSPINVINNYDDNNNNKKEKKKQQQHGWPNLTPSLDQLDIMSTTSQQQLQPQSTSTMVFPIASNYYHNGRAGSQQGNHHQHYRLMLYPHLGHQHQRVAAGAQAFTKPGPESMLPTMNMVMEEKTARFKHATNKQMGRANELPVQADSVLNGGNIGYNWKNSSLVERLLPLRQLNMTGKLDQNANLTVNFNVATFELGNFTTELPERLIQLMVDIEKQEVESLSLRNNSLRFELWGELYALLVVRARRHLYHLDLSHNQLAKLGVTFTGYIEHHLINSRGEWPFGQASNQSSLLKLINLNSGLMSQPLGAGGPMNLQTANLANNSKQQGQQQANKPYTLTSGGKLFTLVQQKLQLLIDQKNQAPGGDSTITRNHPTSTQVTSSSGIQIRALDLSHNLLKWLINDQFRALKHVQSIRLDHNKISFIHQHAFTGLESLRFLNLAHNKLQVVYIEQFQTNYNLQALSVRANAIAYLRAGSFASLANLKQLDLSQNKLTMLSNNAFIGLESLESLNVSSNQFVHAPSGTLHPLTGLRKLDLSNNLIDQLAPGTFFHLPIEELWLNDNEQLVNIDRGAFWDMPYLSRLHLRSCPMLTTINSQAFVGIQNLNFIDVDDCQALEAEARQMLENITMASTYRRLRQEEKQQHQAADETKSVSTISAGNSSGLADKLNSTGSVAHDVTNGLPSMNVNSSQAHLVGQILAKPSITNDFRPSSTAAAVTPDDIGHIIDIANNRLKYAYYATSLVFLIIALKLILKYTQVKSSRRRRRRIYDTSPFGAEGHFGTVGGASLAVDDDDDRLDCSPEMDSLSLSACCSFELQENQNTLTTNENGARVRSESSSRVVSCHSLDARINEGSVDNETVSNGDVVRNYDNDAIINPSAHNDASPSADCDHTDIELHDGLEEIALNDDGGANYSNTCDNFGQVNDDNGLEQGRIINAIGAEAEQQFASDQAQITTQTPQVTGEGLINCDQIELYQQHCTCPHCPQAVGSTMLDLAQTNPDGSQQEFASVLLTGQSMSNEQVNQFTSVACEECNMSRGQSGCEHQQNLSIMSSDIDVTNSVNMNADATTSGQQQDEPLEQLIETQLLQSSYEFDHANCNHFYQSLDSALQFAHLVDNHLNNVDDCFY